MVSGGSPRAGVCVHLPPEATLREHLGHALASVVRTARFSSSLPCRQPRDLAVARASVTQLSCGPVTQIVRKSEIFVITRDCVSRTTPSPAESSPWVECAASTIAPCVSETASLHWRSIAKVALHRLKRTDSGYPARLSMFKIRQCRPLNPRLFVPRFRQGRDTRHSRGGGGMRSYLYQSMSSVVGDLVWTLPEPLGPAWQFDRKSVGIPS